MDRNTQKGFTLIELLITVVILGILIALAAPSMHQLLESRKLKGAAERAFADFQFVKTEAIKRNSPVRLDFTGFGSGNDWCYGFKVNADCDCTETDSTLATFCEIDGIKKVVNQDNYDGAVSLANSTLPFAGVASFNPIRGTTSAGNIEFELSNGAKIKVIVSSLGRIRICSESSIGGYRSCV
jgi:type IV fimbrial biogenesis protein FimT